MKDKLNKIKYKKIFETGNEKVFMRAKDVVWLVDTVESQQKELERLKTMLDKANVLLDKYEYQHG
jgi:hypothetical protein